MAPAMDSPSKVSTHDLKIRPEFFDAWMDGRKRCEIRLDDRHFKVGDKVNLHEWNARKKKPYTGRVIATEILHITPFKEIPGMSSADHGYVALSLAARKLIPRSPAHV